MITGGGHADETRRETAEGRGDGGGVGPADLRDHVDTCALFGSWGQAGPCDCGGTARANLRRYVGERVTLYRWITPDRVGVITGRLISVGEYGAMGILPAAIDEEARGPTTFDASGVFRIQPDEGERGYDE